MKTFDFCAPAQALLIKETAVKVGRKRAANITLTIKFHGGGLETI